MAATMRPIMIYVPQPHEAENSSVSRRLPKVPIERLVFRRSLGESFHERGPVIQNDRCDTAQRHRPGDCSGDA